MFTNDDHIIRIGEGLRDRTLPKPDWTHAAHVAAAVWMLDTYGEQAEGRMSELIRCYNEATGVANTTTGGYHHTITLASLRAIRGAMGSGSLVDRVNDLLRAGLDRPDWLLQHYTKDHLFSVEARLNWVEPDLEPI